AVTNVPRRGSSRTSPSAPSFLSASRIGPRLTPRWSARCVSTRRSPLANSPLHMRFLISSTTCSASVGDESGSRRATRSGISLLLQPAERNQAHHLEPQVCRQQGCLLGRVVGGDDLDDV